MDAMTPSMVAVQDQSARPDRKRTDACGPVAGLLSEVILRDVVPHLLRESRQRQPAPGDISSDDVSEGALDMAVERLTALARGGSAEAVMDYVVDLLGDGHDAEALCLDVLAPVARRLGQGWVDDECDFVDVTIGVWRLRDALRVLSPMLRRADRGRARGRIAAILPLAGEQHTFGASMLAEFFVRAGWTVQGGLGTASELADFVASRHVDLVGFSVSSEDFLALAPAEIEAVRAASRNRDLVVMLGGPCFVGRPELAAALGADGSADDAPAAIARADELLAQRHAARA